MRRVIRAGETAFTRRAGQPRVRKTHPCHRQHPQHLPLVAGFGLELTDAHEVIKRRQGQADLRSMGGWAAQARG